MACKPRSRKGRAKRQIGDITAELGAGDLVIIPKGKKHQHKLTKIGDEPLELAPGIANNHSPGIVGFSITRPTFCNA